MWNDPSGLITRRRLRVSVSAPKSITRTRDRSNPAGLTHDNYLRPRLNALAGRWLVIMEPRRINAFADVNLDDGLKLAIARDLKRVWSEVLEQPLPTELRRLIDRLEQATRGQSLGPE